MKIGLLGGTFDPIHFGHLAAAGSAMECAGLDGVIFVPSAAPPHRAAAVAPAERRLAMCELAIEGHSGFAVSDVEFRRQGPSYTVDTLSELGRLHPRDELFLILGWDAAKLFRTWHEPGRVLTLARVVVVSRPGTSSPQAADLEAAGLDADRVVLCLRATPDISGSSLRRAIAAGEPVEGKVPAAVARYITTHRLYTDNR
ncbi:nicotinate (nicotinamide) nucleotide adenylyltransferase [bacterium]|nr:MAG: nicotinate (nicotinamide) nucleotide adenylyltransferase [bacterium]